jgi:hypothetical protein
MRVCFTREQRGKGKRPAAGAHGAPGVPNFIMLSPREAVDAF